MGGGGGGGVGGDGVETTATTNETTTGSRATENGNDITTDKPQSQPPALQVIVLGSGGGPLESNVTAFLVRSLASGWSKGSVVAVDAGVHLGAIAKILENTQPPALGQSDDVCLPYTLTSGPFRGLEVPNCTSTANAAHIYRNLCDTYLITHPHLDHIAGFIMNTAALPGSRPKRLAGLPSTIAALKRHIFNNVIWPNLTDEDNGVGTVTFTRLVEGGSPALGEGESRGYLEICDGLAVKIWSVSHGHCIERHIHRGSTSSARHGSFDASTMGPIGVGMGLAGNPPLMSPRALAHHNSANTNLSSFLHQQQREQDRMQGGGGSQAGVAAVGGRSGSISGVPGESVCVYDSSAYFIRDVATGREVLIFGDVEPDSISLSPRNQQIWHEAAPKIAAGKLAAILIECSYDDSQCVDRLYGHLTPRFVAEEMSVLAAEVKAARIAIEQEKHVSTPMGRSHSAGYGIDKKKRKRDSLDDQLLLARRKAATPTPHGARHTTPSRTSTTSYPTHLTPNRSSHSEDPVSPKTVKPPSYAPQRRSFSGNNMSSSNHGLSDLSEDTFNGNNVVNLASLNTGGGGAMASVMSKGGSRSGSGSYFGDSPHLATPTAELSLNDIEDGTNANSVTGAAIVQSLSNSGLKVVIIHVKDKLTDGPKVGDVILEELLEHERELQLGCEYLVSEAGQDLYV
ncbi:cAMP phosphodiesterases class-II domain containing protein [Naviculisporaceae sp. PSN 640]